MVLQAGQGVDLPYTQHGAAQHSETLTSNTPWILSATVGLINQPPAAPLRTKPLTLFGPGSPKAEGDKGHDDEHDGAQHYPYDQVRQVAGAGHHGPCPQATLPTADWWALLWGHCWGWQATGQPKGLTSCKRKRQG